MKLLKLTAKNFKRLGSGEFEFTDGVNFVVGPNAAGKSTLLRAVSTALFGVAALPGVVGDVATWGTQSWSLALLFEHAGVTYSVTRDHKTARVEADGALVANGTRPATQYIETLLNRNLKDFNLLTNSRQGETTYALNYGAAALQRDVERLSGADVVEKIIGAAKALRTTLDAQIVAAGDYLLSDEQVQEIEDRQSNYRALATAAAKEIEAQDVVLAAPSPVSTVIDPRTFRKAREKYLVYVTEMGNFRKTMADLEAQLAEMGPEIPEDDGSLELYKGDVTSMVARKRQWERACDEGKSLEKQIASIEIPEGDFDGQIEDASSKLNAVVDAASSASTLLAEKQVEVRHLEKHVKEGICSTCGTVLKGDVEEAKAKLEEARKDHAELQINLTGAENAVRNMRKLLHDLQTQATLQAERTAQKLKLQERLAALDFGSWNSATDEEALQVAERSVHEMSEVVRKAEAHNKERRKLASKLENLSAPKPIDEVTEADVAAAEEAWAAYQSASSEWQVAQAAAKEKKTAAQASLKTYENSLQSAEESLAKHRKMAETATAKKAKFDLAGRLVDFLRERREFYLTKVWDTVLGSASRFLRSSTESWMTGMKLNDGSFMFEDNGGAWVPVVEASGAQSAFLGVALRVGLSQALDHDRSMMLLDEPTEAMREENARRLMAGIGAARDQVIVVTHRATDQALADNIISIGE